MDEAVLDVAVDQAVEQETSTGTQESTQPTESQRKADDKAYADYIKGLREDPTNPHSRRLKDDWGRMESLRRGDPEGIKGVQSRLESLASIAHGDKTGMEAVTSIQEALAESQSTLDAIAQGDFSVLGEDQVDGVLRMAPSMIDHLADSNPDAYTALMLPHFNEALKGSQLYGALDGLLSALNEKPPSWLTKEQIPQWTLEHVQKVSRFAGVMDQWRQAQDNRVKELGGKDVPRGTQVERQQSSPNTEFWEKSIYPQTNAHAEETFNRELRPWAEKLAKAGIRLSDAKKQALAQEMVRDITSAANKNPAYSNQIKRFNSQRSPDSGQVISTFKSEFNRHAKSVMESLIRRDYGQVLEKGGAKPVAKQANGSAKSAPVAPGVKIVSVKPDRSRIDFPRTPADWLYQNKWKMKDGSIEQYRP